MLTACELSFNAEIYANHAKISKASGVQHILRKHSTLILISAGENEWQVCKGDRYLPTQSLEQS